MIGYLKSSADKVFEDSEYLPLSQPQVLDDITEIKIYTHVQTKSSSISILILVIDNLLKLILILQLMFILIVVEMTE